MNCPQCLTTLKSSDTTCSLCGRAVTTGSTNNGQGAYASWGRRVLASLLDGIVPTVLMMVILGVGVANTIQNSVFPSQSSNQLNHCEMLKDTFIALSCSDGTLLRFNLTAILGGLAAVSLLWALYVITAIAGKHQATWGMRVLKIPHPAFGGDEGGFKLPLHRTDRSTSLDTDGGRCFG